MLIRMRTCGSRTGAPDTRSGNRCGCLKQIIPMGGCCQLGDQTSEVVTRLVGIFDLFRSLHRSRKKLELTGRCHTASPRLAAMPDGCRFFFARTWTVVECRSTQLWNEGRRAGQGPSKRCEATALQVRQFMLAHRLCRLAQTRQPALAQHQRKLGKEASLGDRLDSD